MRITALAGGIGGARFLRGLRHHVQQATSDPVSGETAGTGLTEITVIGNTGDDIWIHGLRVCPDLDTVMYTLGDGIDPERGWGRLDETFPRQGGAHRVRGRAHMVRARRPRYRDTPGENDEPERGLPALQRDRGAVRAVATRSPSHPHDGRPRRDARHR